MPIFEFRCQDCGKLFEKLFVDPNEEVKIECPDCNSENFMRVISKTNYSMNDSGGKSNDNKTQPKSCSPGNSCGTIELGSDD